MIEWLATIKAFPDLLKEIYGDLAKPGTQQVGKAIGHILRLPNIILGLSELGEQRMNVWAQKNLDLYREKVNKIPDEDICEVPPEIGVPILEKLAYTTNEDIANLFTELLAKASSVKTIHNAHPAFVQLIGLLSADEAKLILFIGSHYPYRTVIPYINYKINSNDGHSFITIPRYYTSLELQCDFMFKENINLYLENLMNLGLITDEKPIYKDNFAFYKTLLSLDRNESIELVKGIDKSEYKEILQINKSFFNITERGNSFINICTPSDTTFTDVVFTNYEDIDGKRFALGNEVGGEVYGKIVMINTDDEVYVENSGYIYFLYKNASQILKGGR